MDDVRTEPTAKRVRARRGGRWVVDTTDALLVWEHRWYPTWYFPEADVADDLATAPAGIEGYVRLDWDAVDAWFEEDVEVFVHTRDPGVRVDVLASSRSVRIELAGVVLAESDHPTVLFETNLPERFYLPQPDVRWDRLRPSDTTTACPYKGEARYWDVDLDGTRHADLAWSYPTPLPESIDVRGLVCFLDERVDVTVDGVRRERPVTKFA